MDLENLEAPGSRSILSPESPYWEKCARDSGTATARTILHIYLCDSCAVRLTNEACSGRPPIFQESAKAEGYCGLCNGMRAVSLRQWFMCGPCSNVVMGYQRAVAPPQAFRDFWVRNVQSGSPQFTVSERDPVFLSPFRRGGKTKRQVAPTLTNLDFDALEETETSNVRRFLVELKAGPSSMESMREFQLDVNDYNDIVGAVLNTGLPAYIFHVQLAYEYKLPTRRTTAAGLWWTDILALRDRLKRVGRRRGEDKSAAYFHPDAFHPASTFTQQVMNRQFETLQRRIVTAGLEFL